MNENALTNRSYERCKVGYLVCYAIIGAAGGLWAFMTGVTVPSGAQIVF